MLALFAFVLLAVIIDIQNCDIETRLEDSIQCIQVELKDCWVCQLFQTI